MAYQFSSKEISALAEAERMMDSGEMPFVKLDGERVMVRQAVMDELGLQKGQTITVTIFWAIQHENIAYCESQIAIRKAQDAARTR